MTYASQIWGQFSNRHIIRIQKIQNRALRIINFSDFEGIIEFYADICLKIKKAFGWPNITVWKFHILVDFGLRSTCKVYFK